MNKQNEMDLPKCPGCGSNAIRDDSITEGVEGAVRCTKCTFCALISDWEALNIKTPNDQNETGVDFT